MQNRTQPTIRSLILEYSSRVVNESNLLSHGRTYMIKEETNKVGTWKYIQKVKLSHESQIQPQLIQPCSIFLPDPPLSKDPELIHRAGFAISTHNQGHSKNKWLRISLSHKIWQVALPCHFLLNRLSLVKD